MKKVIFSLLMICFVGAYAEEPDNKLKVKTVEEQIFNPINFNDDRFLMLENMDQETQDDAETKNKKSGFRAAIYSALIPGLGEYYAESYWKSAVFAVLEIASWSAYLVYTGNGDEKDTQMRKFGDQNWSENRYWTKIYRDNNPNHGLTINEILEDIDDALKLELREYEKQYTHKLPSSKTQQYYEMIYKYSGQFGAGWIEVGNDWNYYDDLSAELKPQATHYRNLRNKSNDLYKVATTMANVALFNHLVSALDAAWTVKQYNKKIELSLMAEPKYYAGERVTSYGVSVSW